MHYRTIIISDLHLGSPDSKHQKILNFLEENSADKLILNWDIIDFRYLRISRKRPDKQNQVIQKLIDISQTSTNVTYLYGNHDEPIKNIINLKIPNISIQEDLIYTSWDKKYYICHWHQFDKKARIIEWPGFIVWMILFRINRIYNSRRSSKWLQYKSIIRKIKSIAKVFMTWGPKKFNKKVINLIKKHNVDWLICGHIHHAEIRNIWKYIYMNSWDWVESMTAIVENQQNEWELIYYKK